MKVLVGAFNQEKALVGSFSVNVQPVVEPMDRFAAQVIIFIWRKLEYITLAWDHIMTVGRVLDVLLLIYIHLFLSLKVGSNFAIFSTEADRY